MAADPHVHIFFARVLVLPSFDVVQVVSNDLTADGNDELAGYWGGFSGDVGGEALGFLSPLYNGDEFHGNAVQVHLVALKGVRKPRARVVSLLCRGVHRSGKIEATLRNVGLCDVGVEERIRRRQTRDIW